MPNTLEEAERQLAALDVEPEEVVADKGYHSNATMNGIEERGLRGYVSEPDRGRRNWKRDREAPKPTYDNRRRIRGARGKRLLRQRGEKLERAFAHLLETGGLRRVHVRGRENIRKRLLLHAAAFNLGLLMRTRFGHGTPRSLQGLAFAQATLLKQAAQAAYRPVFRLANAILCLIGAKMDRLGLPTVNKRTNISIQLYFVRCLSTRPQNVVLPRTASAA